MVQNQSGGASYSVPSGGTSIAGWSVQFGPLDGGFVALEVWTPTATANVYQLAGMSALQPVAAGTVGIFDLTGSEIAVNPGDLLGLHVDGFVSCVFATGGGSADLVSFGSGGTPAVGGTETLDGQTGVGLAVDVTATVNVTTPPNQIPTMTKQCKGGGWQKLTDTAGTPFKNQGDCVSFVATRGSNVAG